MQPASAGLQVFELLYADSDKTHSYAAALEELGIPSVQAFFLNEFGPSLGRASGWKEGLLQWEELFCCFSVAQKVSLQ